MRRKDRQIDESEALAILKNGEYGILSMVSEKKLPYGIPVNYSFVDNKIYFHCAREGFKNSCLDASPAVSFCVVGETMVLPDQFGTIYESCIVSGLAAEVFSSEKQKALEGFIQKYSAGFIAEGAQYIDKMTARTKVYGISIDEITGKARRH